MINAAKHEVNEIKSIPVDQIDVLNTRTRNEAVFQEIRTNIRMVGLKKPITVTPRNPGEEPQRYLLVCGEGRLLAFKSLQQQTIPARVIHVSGEDALIMGLAENIGRRHYKPLELFATITLMQSKGYSANVISKKTGMSLTYAKGLISLLDGGEERLLAAVENGKIPMYAALAMVGRDGVEADRDLQKFLMDEVESGRIKATEVAEIKKMAAKRKEFGKGYGGLKRVLRVSNKDLLQSYRNQVAKQQVIVRNAELAQTRLLFITSAIANFLQEEHFCTILRAEKLDTLPQYLAERVVQNEALG
jgi:ParB family transcriptional regulator, chromosome partitioning protein